MTKIGADGDKRVGAQARHLPPPLTFHAKAGAEQCRGEVDGGPGKLTSLAICAETRTGLELARLASANLCERLRVQFFAQFQRAHPKVF